MRPSVLWETGRTGLLRARYFQETLWAQVLASSHAKKKKKKKPLRSPKETSVSCDYLQFSSVAQSCPTLCNPMDCSTPGFPVHCQLPEFSQTHVHWVGDAIQPSHPLSSRSPPALNLSEHQGSFPVSQFFTSGGQNIGVSVSTSVLPMNTQDWSPLGWTVCNLLPKCMLHSLYTLH